MYTETISLYAYKVGHPIASLLSHDLIVTHLETGKMDAGVEFWALIKYSSHGRLVAQVHLVEN